MARQISDGLAPLVDLIYPPRCPLCGDALGQQGGLCLECWQKLEVPSAQSSYAISPSLPVIPATIYGEASRQLILALKHGRKIAFAPILARLMAARLDPHEGEEGASPLLIPVPLHRYRLWKRGFNQAALLAIQLEKLGKGDLLIDGLIRTKSTPMLGGLGKEERARVLKNAIAARRSRKDAIAGRDIILVDDVCTSGATSRSCAKALTQAGAKSVTLACFAIVGGGAQTGTETLA